VPATAITNFVALVRVNRYGGQHEPEVSLKVTELLGNVIGQVIKNAGGLWIVDEPPAAAMTGKESAIDGA